MNKICIFYCANNTSTAVMLRDYAKGKDELKIMALPCSGKIDILYLTKAFETGAEGVAVLSCLEGECRYLEGNLRAWKRVESTNELLDEIGLGKGRAAVIKVSDSNIENTVNELDRFCTYIKSLSPQTKEVEPVTRRAFPRERESVVPELVNA